IALVALPWRANPNRAASYDGGSSLGIKSERDDRRLSTAARAPVYGARFSDPAPQRGVARFQRLVSPLPVPGSDRGPHAGILALRPGSIHQPLLDRKSTR